MGKGGERKKGKGREREGENTEVTVHEMEERPREK